MPHDEQNLEYGIVPATGTTVDDFDMQKDVAIPTSYSAGGWTYGNEGFAQQTFLGASIRDFTLNAGFNNTSSTLSANLVADEYNLSDNTRRGFGDDVYHSGAWASTGVGGDVFSPPVVGSPVFFKFGKHHATVEEAFRVVYDSIYIDPFTGKNYNTVPVTNQRVKEAIKAKSRGQGGISNMDELEETSESDLPKYESPDEPIEVFFSGVPSELGKYYPGDPILSTTDPTARNQVVDKSEFLNTNIRGSGHISFGGILQSYTQNRGGEGNPTYAVSMTDPRELLGNVELILGNYAGSTFNNPNMLNIYGFLEHNPSDALRAALENYYDNTIGDGMGGLVQTIDEPPKRIKPVLFTDPRPLVGSYPKGGELYKLVNYNTGAITFVGDDMWCKDHVYPTQYIQSPGIIDGLPRTEFPITGTGFSRRNEEGVPIYRVVQAMRALMNYDGKTPEEYITAGYGGPINFRGYNYVVDLTGLPIAALSKFYRLNYEKTTLLEFCQEICEITSHEMFVSLFPVIDHPACGFVNDYNNYLSKHKPLGWQGKMVQGVIRVEGISKTQKPEYGTVKAFIDRLTLGDNNVSNSDVGFELSNVVTDKFVVGAQEVKMYYFSDNRDRDHLQIRKALCGFGNRANSLMSEQWYHWKSLQQQIIPFYGLLGKDATTIPRGWGAFQQILLDASSCDAVGVGNYYIATELELRAAAVSYSRWSQFLIRYNSEFMASMEINDALEESLLSTTVAPPSGLAAMSGLQPLDPKISNNFGISVPRCVFMSDKDFMGSDNLPASPCSPPFGYPLYYKRAEKIGIPEAGVVKVINSINDIITNLGTLQGKFKDGAQAEQIDMGEFTAMKAEIIKELTVWLSDSNAEGWNDQSSAFVMTFIDELGNTKASNLSEILDQIELFTIESAAAIEFSSLVKLHTVTGELEATQDRNEAVADQIGLLKEKITNNIGLIRNRNRLGKLSMENARKVYNFVKGVSDKHLGKTFLVKLPKDTNVSYADAIIHSKAGGTKSSFVAEISAGPFGFRPEPVNYQFGHYYNKTFQSQMIALASMHTEPFHFLNAGTRPNSSTGPRQKSQFSAGALKSNYNSIDNKWLHNYEPMPEGGFHDYSQMPQTYGYADIRKAIATAGASMLPPCVRYNLFPVDLTNFVESDGRMKAYVRYDNSQYLNFQGVSKERLSQQVLTFGGTFIPDLLEQLDNIKPDKFTSFGSKNRLQGHRLRRSVAFVQVDLDKKLYMPPMSDVHLVDVFGRVPKDIGTIVKPSIVFDNETCDFKPSYGFYRSHWVPGRNGGKGGGKAKIVDFLRTQTPLGNIIATDPVNLDGDNIYAMITVPGSVKSTVDSRYADGPMQNFNPADIKNFLTMDTVKIPEFRAPTVRGNPTSIVEDLCVSDAGFPATNVQLQPDQILRAVKSVTDGFRNVSMASPERSLQYTTSSPIYPNLVALPLMSKERCYGPWLSSSYDTDDPMAIRYLGIGGKMEYTKDEELAPWNYGGFDVLNAAGTVKASFSNSELLFSERGGIVFAGAPEGNALGRNLDAVGPLVTSVSVNVGPGGVETTYKMDLYTPRFGKLQEQKEKAIQKFGRARQQQIDERNKSLRGSIKKGMTGSVNISSELSQYNSLIEAAKNSSDFLSDFEKDSTSMDLLFGSVNTSEVTTHDGAGNEIAVLRRGYDISFQDTKKHQEALAALPQEVRDRVMKNTAGGQPPWAPVSLDVFHKEMASAGYHPYKGSFYEQGNPGEVRVAQDGLPTRAGELGLGHEPGGGAVGGLVFDLSIGPGDSTNYNLGAAGGRDGTGGMLGGMGDGATS
jgi:hypothetical protein